MERGFERARRPDRRRGPRARASGAGRCCRRRRDGTTFPAACTVVGLEGCGRDASRTSSAVERDITDELTLRDQLVHSERLSAVGELVAGVAHEINNPLQTIVGSVELMLERAAEPPSRGATSRWCAAKATRAGQIVRNLLSFVRRSAPDRAVADLNDIVRATVELREYHLRQRNIALVTELQSRGRCRCSSTARRFSRSC